MIPDQFNPVNVTDTCAVWHIVGADTLFRAAIRARLSFIITPTVFYECFVKTTGHRLTPERQALREALRGHLSEQRVARMEISIAALQETVQLAKARGSDKRLGQGELSCAALARTIGHAAVLTDNKRDFTAIGGLVDGRLQKTPLMLGWLYVEGHLTDADVAEVNREHRASNGHMEKIYERAYQMACEKRLMRHIAAQQVDEPTAGEMA